MRFHYIALSLIFGIAAVFASLSAPQASGSGEALRGQVKIDGSSTVFPVSEAVAEEFQKEHPRVRVTVGVSGTGGGFKKFIAGEIDISDASRPIKKNEREQALKRGVKFIELPVAYDGLSVVVNPRNKFVDSLSLEQLKKIWQPGSKVTHWSDVDPSWPKRKIKLYGPGPDSGTFDYFTEVVVGKSKASRPDYMSSEDDNVLVRGIAGDVDALGYFGYAYYAENANKLKLVGVQKTATAKTILPSPTSIENQSYALARPIFIYVSTKAADRKEVNSFVNFYIDNAGKLAKDVGYVPLSNSMYEEIRKRYQERSSGTKFSAVKKNPSAKKV